MEDALRATLLAELRLVAVPTRAPAMQAYMKSTMPYLGVQADDLRAACRRAFGGLAFPSATAWRRAALSLWRRAHYREERHGAIELTGIRSADRFQTPRSLPMYEEMIVTGAWWDYVDQIASHRLGTLLRRHPAVVRARLLAWSRSDNVWKRRAAILSQLSFKGDTDLALLYACIEPSFGATDFFLRKGIGWALRQYAWTNLGEVVRYVHAHDAMLSPLTKREALKNIARARLGVRTS